MRQGSASHSGAGGRGWPTSWSGFAMTLFDYFSVFLIGLFGSGHCLGMCGGFALAVAAPASNWKGVLARHLVYQAGKSLTYLFLAIIVAAVFSGAVFGDHCSPFSDTTIVTSISCGVEPHDHVRTQIPYALITAVVAVGFGFLPAGLGFPGLASLGLGAAALLMLPKVTAGLRSRSRP